MNAIGDEDYSQVLRADSWMHLANRPQCIVTLN